MEYQKREIKFRCWDIQKKKWYEIPDWGQCEAEGNSGGGIMELKDNGFFLWSQFTGLLDRHGKEIYFGDVINADCTSTGENDPQYDFLRGGGRQKLFCECDSHYLRIRFTQTPGGLFEFQPHELRDIEIIGNIYENESLLK